MTSSQKCKSTCLKLVITEYHIWLTKHRATTANLICRLRMMVKSGASGAKSLLLELFNRPDHLTNELKARKEEVALPTLNMVAGVQPFMAADFMTNPENCQIGLSYRFSVNPISVPEYSDDEDSGAASESHITLVEVMLALAGRSLVESGTWTDKILTDSEREAIINGFTGEIVSVDELLNPLNSEEKAELEYSFYNWTTCIPSATGHKAQYDAYLAAVEAFSIAKATALKSNTPLPKRFARHPTWTAEASILFFIEKINSGIPVFFL
jgi:hypothetical protein